MSTMPAYPSADEQSLTKLDLAHKGLHGAIQAYQDELDKAMKDIEMKHNPFIFAAESVVYEAMGNAALNGFSREEMYQAMGCAGH